MNYKRAFLAGLVSVIIIGGCTVLFFMTDKGKKTEEIKIQPKPQVETTEQKAVTPVTLPVSEKTVKNVSNEVLDKGYYGKLIPLSAIYDYNSFSDKTQKAIKNVIEKSPKGIYFYESSKDKIFIISDSSAENSTWMRHDFDVITIYPETGETTVESSNQVKESENDIWEYNEVMDVSVPVKHIHFNNDGNIEFTEYWNYSQEEPVRYKMTDENDKTISILKETTEGDDKLRQEHIFYDKDGNVKKSLSTNFEGADISRVTYYDSNSPENSATVVNEYSDGLKTKETVYTSDYKLKNTYTAEYKDNERTSVSNSNDTALNVQ